MSLSDPDAPTFVQFTVQSTGQPELDAIAICLDAFHWLDNSEAVDRVLRYLNDRVTGGTVR